MPQIRARPKYPGLRTDGKIDRNMVSGQDGIGCSKFFAEYSKKGYTGGILAFWCVHGICYGFHCIPDGEGRNDAFSALYTRWRKAPKVVIYDFACTLGPYCMQCEPKFFTRTRFLIDGFPRKMDQALKFDQDVSVSPFRPSASLHSRSDMLWPGLPFFKGSILYNN